MTTPQFRDWVEKARVISVAAILDQRHITNLKGRAGKLAGPCPQCGGDDRFAVDTERGLFHCRGCGGKGQGAISLIQFLDGTSFLQAVEAITGEPPPNGKAEPKKRERKARGKYVCSYSYTDEIGAELYQVLRYADPKGFAQRQNDPHYPGQWINNLNGVRLVPYHLPDMIEAIAAEQPVYWFEGEKDADNAAKLGLITTTTAMGLAGKGHWQSGAYDQFFRDADVVLVPDQDADDRKGRELANVIGQRLAGVAERVRVLTLPVKDVSEWIELGGNRETFDALAESAPEFSTEPEAKGSGNGHDPQPAVKVLQKESFMAGFTPPDYLIESVLQRRFVYALTGQTGHAKTAIALLLAELVACADPNSMLGTHRVEKGRVVYFVGENPDDIRMRLIGADSTRRDDPAKDRIWFIPGVFNIAEVYATLATQIATIGGCDLVIIDTSAAYFLGQDENANPQIGAHARMLRKLTELPGAPCVLVLCHPIKHVTEPSQLLPRGGSAFLAEMDGNLTAWKNDDMIELHHSKMRGPGFEPMMFKLDKILTPDLTDKRGHMIPTVRAVLISQTDETTNQKRTREDEDRVLAALLDNPDASLAEIAVRWGWLFAKGEPARSRVQRAITRLDLQAKPKLLRKNRDKWELTEDGKKAAREAAILFERQNEMSTQQTLDLEVR